MHKMFQRTLILIRYTQILIKTLFSSKKETENTLRNEETMIRTKLDLPVNFTN